MGAEQSSTRGAAAAADAPKKTDYYELLGVDEQAGDDEIKKAYRKKALELHPDRNYGDVERATQRFAEVQAAYEVLADPQERAWYDSHRDAILRGDDPTDDAAGARHPPQYRDVHLVTVEEIYALIGRFNKTVPLDDSPGSFFTVLRGTFDRIADGEDAAAEAAADDDDGSPPVEYPSFGTAQDDEKTARRFYGAWQGFATRLSFAWRDRWRLSDAPDRRVRRLMEKENKKLREDAAREFSDAVRALVVFVRKRDPRYTPSTQSEAERQKVLRDAAAAQAARSRAAHQKKLQRSEAGGGADASAVPEWAQSRAGEREAHLGEFTESEDESEVEHIECVVCDKTFKSERQYEAHEKSKKHVKAVQQLRRQMKKENANLDLKGEPPKKSQSKPKPASARDNDIGEYGPEDEDDVDEEKQRGDDGLETPLTEATTTTTSRTETEPPASPSTISTTAASDNNNNDEDSGDEYASRDAVEARLTGQPKRGQRQQRNPFSLSGDDHDGHKDADKEADDLAAKVDTLSIEGEDTGGEAAQQKKVGKAKAKREKKAARQAAAGSSETHTCTGCNETFESRTKLFRHVEESGHAALKAAVPASSKSGKKKKKR